MSRVLEFLSELLLMFLMIAVCNTAGTKKYMIIIFVSLLLLLLGRKKKWSAETLICISLPVMVYLITGSFSTMINSCAQMAAIKIVLFWMTPLAAAFAMYVFYGKKMPVLVDLQFVSCCIIYAVLNTHFILEHGKSESTFAFVFGAYLVYYACKKRWLPCAVSAVCVYFADKRIVVLAALAALAVMAFLWIFRNHRKLAITVWGTVTAAVSFYIWLICSGGLQYFSQGIGINTNGRSKMYGTVIEWFGTDGILFGNGLGVVEHLLEYWKVYKFNNLHNDLLKFYIELGIVGFLLFFAGYGVAFWLIGKKYGKSEMCRLLGLTVYSMVLFATDNVSIYILYLLPLYSIYFAVLAVKENEEIIEEYDKENN